MNCAVCGVPLCLGSPEGRQTRLSYCGNNAAGEPVFVHKCCVAFESSLTELAEVRFFDLACSKCNGDVTDTAACSAAVRGGRLVLAHRRC